MGESGKRLKPTFKYLFSWRGLALLLLALVPSYMTAMLISPSSMLYFMCNYFKIPSYDFGTMYMLMISFNSRFYYVGIIGAFLFTFIIAVILGAVDRHMRIGEFSISLSRAKTRINYNFLTALKMLLFMVILFELYNLVTVSFALLWTITFKTSIITAFVFTLITFLIFSFAMMFVFCSTILWVPFMLHTGATTFEAFKMAVRHNMGGVLRECFVIFLTIFPFILLMILNGFLGWGGFARSLIDGCCLAVLAVVYIVMMYTVFFDVTGTERMDLIQEKERKNIWSKRDIRRLQKGRKKED